MKQMIVKAQQRLENVKDKRLYWLKDQYLKLFFDDKGCSGPRPAEAIKVGISELIMILFNFCLEYSYEYCNLEYTC